MAELVSRSSMNQLRYSSSSSPCPSKKTHRPGFSSCGGKAVEFTCNVCLLCVSCPVAVAWCLIKIPCELGWHTACYVRKRVCCCCMGTDRMVFAAEYSSFSDNENNRRGQTKNADAASPNGKGRRKNEKVPNAGSCCLQ